MLAGEKPVKILEANPGGPVNERTGSGRLIWRCIVPLSPGGGAVPVVLEHLGDRGAALRDDARVAIPIICQFPDLTIADTMMIATREQGRACGRTHRSRVKTVIRKSLVGDLAQRRGVDFAAVSVGLGRPDIVNKHDENVRRILPQMAQRRERIVIDSCIVRSAVLPEGFGGKGKTSCAAVEIA